MKKIYYLFLIFLLSETCMIYAQTPEKVFENELKHYFASYKTTARIKQPEFQSLTVDENKKTITITVSESLAYQPFTSKIVDEMYESIQKQLPKSLRKYQLKVYTNESLIEELIPNALRNKKTKDKSRLSLKTSYKGSPWVKSTSKPHKISEGLQNRHIALWQSHGSYYIKEKNEWGWQRPNLFCTTEDLFTQSFIVPYIIPMLENAGACVFTPRERDIQHQEVIVDNDTSNGSIYLEENSKKSRWASTNKPGFAQKKNIYLDNENPFEDGKIGRAHV